MFGRTKKQPEAGADRRRSMLNQAESRPAFSYYASTNRTERPAEAPARRGSLVEGGKPRRRLNMNMHAVLGRLPLLFVVALIVVCLVKIMTLSNTPRVVVVGHGTDANYVQENGVYAQAAAKLLGASKLNGFKLTADLNGVSKKLQAEFPELQTVSITAPFIGNKPIVYVMPAQAGVLLQTGSGTFAVNGSGVVLSEIAGQTSVHGVRVIDQTGVQPAIGKRILPASTVDFIQRLNYQLSAAKQTVATMTLPANSPYQIDVQLAGQAYHIKCNLRGDPVEQAGSALAVLQQLGSGPAQYLDVRVPGRAYYQ